MTCPRCGKPIDDHEADRETDACVAEVVMGWIRLDTGNVIELPTSTAIVTELVGPGTGRLMYPVWSRGDGRFFPEKNWYPPRYSTDIAAAWEVLERALRFDVGTDGMIYLCHYGNTPKMVGASAPTAPLAICRAALKACANDR